MPRKVEAPEGGYKRLPALRPEDLGGNDFAVVTIVEVVDNVPVVKPDGRKKFQMRMTFAEFPERNFWPNATSRGFLDKRLGRDCRGWKGGVAVLEVVETENPAGEPVLSVWVARPQDWGEVLRQYKTGAGETPAAAKPATAAEPY